MVRAPITEVAGNIIPARVVPSAVGFLEAGLWQAKFWEPRSLAGKICERQRANGATKMNMNFDTVYRSYFRLPQQFR